MNERVSVALICDDNYVMPASVVIASIIKNKHKDSHLDIYIVTADLSDESALIFSSFESDTVRIIIKKDTVAAFESLHNFSDGTQKTRITTSALLKFKLAEIVTECDKLLYLDCDVIVCEDLSALYSQDISDYFCAAVLNTTRLYLNNNSHHMHTYMLIYRDYFNSGVLLLNLKRMRDEKSYDKLIRAKAEMTDAYFMDQDQLNAVFHGFVKFLPIRYNAQYVNLARASNRFDIPSLNQMYGTDYETLQDVAEDAAVIHYASADKPWLSMSVPLAKEWYECYLFAKIMCPDIAQRNRISFAPAKDAAPMVSVIIPTFNVADYIPESIGSVLSQTLKNIQIICVDDGSTDETLNRLREIKDERLVVLSQRNKGPSSARNLGLAKATGKYVYFFGGDDILEESALETLYNHAKTTGSSVVLFDGTCIFDSDDLESRFSHRIDWYRRAREYPGISRGDDLYPQMVKNDDCVHQTWLQFFERRYLADNDLAFSTSAALHQENVFSMKAQLLCPAVSHIQENLCRHRVREGSISTAPDHQKDMLGYYTCVVEMLGFLAVNQHKLSDSTMIATKDSLQILFVKACNKYRRLSKRNRIQPMFLDPYLNVVSGAVFFPLSFYGGRKKNRRMGLIRRGIFYIASTVWRVVRPVARKSKLLTSFAEKFHQTFFD